VNRYLIEIPSRPTLATWGAPRFMRSAPVEAGRARFPLAPGHALSGTPKSSGTWPKVFKITASSNSPRLRSPLREKATAPALAWFEAIASARRIAAAPLKNAMVKYESRGKTAHGRSWGALTTISIVRFARDVEREVPCDHDPRYPADTP
jgi:hypothetical protein